MRRVASGLLVFAGVLAAIPAAAALPVDPIIIDVPQPGSAQFGPAISVSLHAYGDVWAEVAGVKKKLEVQYGQDQNGQYRVLGSIASDSYGPNTVIRFSTSDIPGMGATREVTFIHDRFSRVEVIDPPRWSLVRGSTVRLLGTCTDFLVPGCQSVTVNPFGEKQTMAPIALGKFDITVDIAAIGATNLEVRTAPVPNEEYSIPLVRMGDDDGRLIDAFTASGLLLDADPRRALVMDPAEIKVVDRTSGAAQVLWKAPAEAALTDAEGNLTPAGAFFRVRTTLATNSFELRGGEVAPAAHGWVRGATVAVYAQGDVLVRRDLDTGQETPVPLMVRLDLVRLVAVGLDGSIVYEIYGQAGNTQMFANRIDQTRFVDEFPINAGFDPQPMTDGLNCIYRRGKGDVFELVLNRPEGSHVIASPHMKPVYALGDYWVAFTRADVNGIKQLWVQGPDGTQTALSSFGADLEITQIEEVRDPGEVAWIATTVADGIPWRFIARPGVPPRRLGSGVGTAFRMGQTWHLRAGRELFALRTPWSDDASDAAADAAEPGGGSDDAGAGPSSADAAAADPDAAVASHNESGCGCRTGGAGARSPLAAMGIVLVLWRAARRRRPRSQIPCSA
jgi:MYXO-CTERM domain-containing protein